MELAEGILAPLAQLLGGMLTSIICILLVSENCIPQSAQQMHFYQWTDEGRVELNSSYSTIRPMAPTYFIVHGWKVNSSTLPFENIAMNYYKMDPRANIILVDYGIMADRPYTLAPQIAKLAGSMMGLQIVRMMKKNLIRVQDIQFWGHSLGAHVSGVAAQVIQNETGIRVPRISAADPAGPIFEDALVDSVFIEALRKEDTDFLDITHTSYGAGSIKAYGTVDTYVGLGAFQPACLHTFDPNPIDLVACDHSMSKYYYAESILSCGFQAQKFNLQLEIPFISVKTVTWGQHMPLNTTGVYILKTNGAPPYAKSPNTYPSCRNNEKKTTKASIIAKP